MSKFWNYLKIADPELASTIVESMSPSVVNQLTMVVEEYADYQVKGAQIQATEQPNSQVYSNDFPVTPYDGMR